MSDLELLTVKQAGEHLFMSEQGVRRLVKSGKLEALKERGKLLIKPESVQAYISAQPHPIHLMSALRGADFELGILKSIQFHGGMNARSVYGFGRQAEFEYYERRMPLLQTLKESVRAKDYEKAEETRHQLWREYLDYEMLHRPLRIGEVRQCPKKPEWAMDMLFDDESKN